MSGVWREWERTWIKGVKLKSEHFYVEEPNRLTDEAITFLSPLSITSEGEINEGLTDKGNSLFQLIKFNKISDHSTRLMLIKFEVIYCLIQM